MLVLDTVNLKGEGFEVLVSMGEQGEGRNTNVEN
uniref:Uncharacterized protein n=1 Tax=Clostridioides difficile TaxID=1496 RepID=A0A381KL89_CLODI|nr:Uncharacterised protein [Clostridioides difficile]